MGRLRRQCGSEQRTDHLSEEDLESGHEPGFTRIFLMRTLKTDGSSLLPSAKNPESLPSTAYVRTIRAATWHIPNILQPARHRPITVTTIFWPTSVRIAGQLAGSNCPNTYATRRIRDWRLCEHRGCSLSSDRRSSRQYLYDAQCTVHTV